MKGYNHFSQAWVNLVAAKLRSFLAVLGILVGTAAVVALINCGELATEKALEQFKNLGTDLLALSLFPQNPNKISAAQAPFSLAKWRALPQKINAIKRIAPYSAGYQPIFFEGHKVEGVIIGADESLANIIHIRLKQGYFVSFVDGYEHFCVIGAGIATQLQAIHFINPLGRQIRIGQMLYTIIGIAKPWRENGFFNEDINQAVIIPLTSMVLLNKDNKINNAVLQLKEETNIDKTIDEIKQSIQSEVSDVTIFFRSARQIIAGMKSQGHIFTLLLAVIGGISLLVGGIGVMNVMLASVSERKKEIGIRKAIGAKNKEIQVLFLTEAVLLSLLGGVLGEVAGVFFTWLVAYFSNWKFNVLFMPLLAGFAVSFITGVFFGFYPARRASKLQAAITLRNE